MVTAMGPHRAALARSSASPAGLSLHAVRRSGRCRAADSGSDEQGEPQQQLKQVTEDVKQQAEEATQGTWDSKRSLLLAGLMCMCLLIAWLRSCLAWPFSTVLHHPCARHQLEGSWYDEDLRAFIACRWREDAGICRQPHHVDASLGELHITKVMNSYRQSTPS